MTTTISALVSLPDSPSTYSPLTLYGASPLLPLPEPQKEGRSTSAPSMIRKRPARICIPAQEKKRLLELGSWGGNEEEDGIGEVEVEVEEDGLTANLVWLQAFFGVFDGHGGAKASDFVAEHLHANIKEQLAWDDSNVQKAVRDAYLKATRNLRVGIMTMELVAARVVFRLWYTKDVSSCRMLAIVVLSVSSDGVAEALTTDHLPSVLSEKERITARGGYVDCYNGIWRIQGSLAVSRSIGDQYLKQWEFLILASDGLWDKVSNQEAVEVARPLLIGNGKPRSSSACRELAELSMRRGSRDDITVMIVELGQFVDSNSAETC
ncbi:hypothetical protein MLD38_008682 [Melastoma candidum]|uniref:Uncharacterized protein n=1 Tax=Melastoma candidum TaxID=119954 RepID=A0ACB9RVA9_9MYRT|nr:hypothetical protein MLD38_008682 [Melastoma candidum]